MFQLGKNIHLLADELIIELDPGWHLEQVHIRQPLCVFKHLEKTVKKGDIVMDVGTGSGVLSIAAAMLGAKTCNSTRFR